MNGEQPDHASLLEVPTKQWSILPYQVQRHSFWSCPEMICSWLHRDCGRAWRQSRSQSFVIPTHHLEWELSFPTELFSYYCDIDLLNSRDDKKPVRASFGALSTVSFLPEITAPKWTASVNEWAGGCVVEEQIISDCSLLQNLNHLHLTVIL